MGRRRLQSETAKAKLYKLIRKHKNVILNGTLLALDPSCASSSSDPGYAIYERGKLLDKGIIEVPSKGSKSVPQRLQDIRRCMVEDFDMHIDVIVVEDVSNLPKRRGSNQLIKSQGAMLCALDCDKVLEITPVVWQDASVDKFYVKGDDTDAEYIGLAVLNIAKEDQT